jgi:ribosomal protein S18 acetylase RimI-like enzyme
MCERLAGCGMTLRAAAATDMPFLHRLYAGTRAAELLPSPWSPAEKAAFCASQFALQHAGYVRRFPRGDFWIVSQRLDGMERDIGRLSVQRKSKAWRLIDIVVAAEARKQGLGTALIQWVQASAACAGAEAVDLTVLTSNSRARALYLRLGFEDAGDGDGLHQSMRWRPA